MAPGTSKISPLAQLALLTFVTASLANQLPYHLFATPTPAAAVLPALQARQTAASPTSSADSLVGSCSDAISTLYWFGPTLGGDLADWLSGRLTGTCDNYPTTGIPASLTSELSSLKSAESFFTCERSSVLELVFNTCIELPEFSATLVPYAEECQTWKQCGDNGTEGDSGDDGGDGGEQNEEGNNGSGDGGSGNQDGGSDHDENAAPRLMDMGVAAAAVAGILAVAVL